MRILIVEDERELLQDIAKGLTLKGYAVDQADNGTLGCQMAIDEAYDLIVLDLNLPGMDGFSLLKELRQERPQTKVLILSANSELDSKLSGFELGASDYLTKPFHFAELEARIRVLLNRKFVQQSNCLTYESLSEHSESHRRSKRPARCSYDERMLYSGVFPFESGPFDHPAGVD